MQQFFRSNGRSKRCYERERGAAEKLIDTPDPRSKVMHVTLLCFSKSIDLFVKISPENSSWSAATQPARVKGVEKRQRSANKGVPNVYIDPADKALEVHDLRLKGRHHFYVAVMYPISGRRQSLWFAKRSLKPYNLPLIPHLAKQRSKSDCVCNVSGENDSLARKTWLIPAIPVTADLENPRGIREQP
ncbi:hypothetical protein NPIL_303961 [Nephila pilipes]|uniref:Uncharacterized protein n=1 Tax=Nephila pilipes TaxID=299642 RepID=A0A8X6N9B3_NEPPI|nr:hypothetical protein NPIL_303961 [Nephila pilipes]